LSHTVHKYGLGLSSCGRSVTLLLSVSLFTSTEVSPVYIVTKFRWMQKYYRYRYTQ